MFERIKAALGIPGPKNKELAANAQVKLVQDYTTTIQQPSALDSILARVHVCGDVATALERVRKDLSTMRASLIQTEVNVDARPNSESGFRP